MVLRRLPRHFTARFLNSVVGTSKRPFGNNTNIISSAIPDIEIPNTTIPEFVFKDFNRFPHKIAVECALTGKKYTFEELRTKSRNFSRALRKKLKLNRGDVIGILLPNVPEYSICVLGALEAGLTVTTLNPLYTAEIKKQLADADVTAIITLGTLWDVAKAAINLLPVQIPVIAVKSQIWNGNLPRCNIKLFEWNTPTIEDAFLLRINHHPASPSRQRLTDVEQLAALKFYMQKQAELNSTPESKHLQDALKLPELCKRTLPELKFFIDNQMRPPNTPAKCRYKKKCARRPTGRDVVERKRWSQPALGALTEAFREYININSKKLPSKAEIRLAINEYSPLQDRSV